MHNRMNKYSDLEWMFERIILEAKSKDIFDSLFNHYVDIAGLDGVERDLVVDFVIDSFASFLEDLSPEKLIDVERSLVDDNDPVSVSRSIDELAIELESRFSGWMVDKYEDDQEEEYEEEELGWELNSTDHEAIRFAITAAYEILCKPGILPYEIQGIARAIYALKYLPKFENDINVSFGIYKQNGDSDFSERFSLDFVINQDHFKIYESWSNYDSAVGSDNRSSIIYFYGPGYEREVNDLLSSKNRFYSFLNSSEISVEDESDNDIYLDEE